MAIQPVTSMEGVLASLTEPQQQAVTHVDGPLLILAGPGSGKTRVVTHRVAYLLAQGIPPAEIVALTFTNKAADEMRLRLDRLAPENTVWMGTFHRFCSRLLRRYAPLVGLRENFSICDVEDSRKLLKEALTEANVELIHETPANVANAISAAKNDLIAPEDYVGALGSPLGSITQRVYPEYQRRLLAANAVDFDDLLMHVARMLRENDELRSTLDARFRYILVDEYQDTNLAQYAIVRALSVEHPNLAVTGDPDQSIYGWRGATIRNILEFERDFPKVNVVRLEQNYRSTKRILHAADELIARNFQRKDKVLYTDNPEGKPVRVVVYQSGRLEAEAIAARIANAVAAGQRRPKDFAIFYRTNALSRGLERALKTVELPYQIVRGLEFYQRKEVKDVLAYLHLLNNPANDVAFLRIINTPPRRIGKTTVNRLTKHARQKGISLLEAARESGLIESLSKRTAVHVAKFVAMLDGMQLAGGEKVEEVLGTVLFHTKYREWLAAMENEEDRQRVENIDELLTDAREFDEAHHDDGGLESFLEQASLVADVDAWEVESDRVTLMTLHAAKGLEFPVVFIVAVEHDLLPHERNADDPDKVEEERRLLFVGMTRAEEELQLSAAQARTIRGSHQPAGASVFFTDLPLDKMEVIGQIEAAGGIRGDTLLDESWESPEAPFDESPYFDEDETASQHGAPAPRRRKPPAKRKRERTVSRSASGPPFVTAAEMLGTNAVEPKCSPETFEHGAVVTHPLYGLGKIVALSGTGKKRSATVQFAGEPRTRNFQLLFSELRPARG